MANSIPQLAWMTDAKGWIYWYNDRWYDYTGTTPEEMVGWGWKKVHHPDLVEEVVKRFTVAIETASPWEDTFLLRSREGEYRWFLSRSIPVKKDDGTLIGWFGTNTDITEQRKTEEALKKSEEILRLAVEGAELGYFDFNPVTKELNWSGRTKELFGLPPNEVVDYDNYLKAVHPADRAQNLTIFQSILQNKSNSRYEMEYRVIRASDGGIRWIRSRGMAFFDEQGNAYRVAGVIQDITKQKEAEEALKRSESTLRNLVLQAPVAMCIGHGPSFIVEVANDRMLELWGKQAEEIIGYPVFDVLTEVGEQGLKQLIEEAYATQKRFTANEMPVSLLRNGTVETVYVNFVYEPVKDGDGETRIFAVAIDVTEQVIARKKIESFAEILEKLVEERTRELQRSNEDLQQFAHVASHDLKEPVRKIKTFVGNVQRELSEQLNESALFYLSRVQAAANRMLSMIDGVLAYSTTSALEEIYEPVDLNQVIKNVEADLEVTIHQKEATIKYDHLPTLEAAPLMLYQVFYNLISNSLKFARTDEASVITITSTIIEKKGMPFACIVLEDNGIGFEQKYAEKIFGTFIRLHPKDKYEGAGLGLSLCKKIIERHGGAITAKAGDNNGAVFEIELPVKRLFV